MIILFYGCATQKVYDFQISEKLEIQSTNPEFLKLIKSDLEKIQSDYKISFPNEWSKKLNIKPYKSIAEFLIGEVKLIHYSPHNCRSDQMACSYPDRKFEIYVNDHFIERKEIERLSTLLHELVHHLTSYTHFVCYDQETQKQFSCDESLYSSYGIEVYFLSELTKFKSIDQSEISSLLARLRKRVVN